MDIEYMREYLTVAGELNFTRSAKILNTTQSTLSKHIAVLERDFGVQLLNRNGKSVELTQAGTMLYRRARTIVSEFDSAQAELHRLASSPNVKLGGMLSNGEVISLISKATALLKAQEHPSALLTTVMYEPFYEHLIKRDMDCVICHANDDFDFDPLLGSRPLLKSPFTLIVEKDHPLASRTAVSILDLRDFPFVQLIGEYASAGWKIIDRVCVDHGFSPRKYPIVVNSAIDCLTEPLGDALLIVSSSLFMGGVMPYEDFRIIPLQDEDAFFPLNVYFRKADEERLSGLLDVLGKAGTQLQVSIENASKPITSRPFQSRCRSLAKQYGINETELEAMIGFAKGRSLDRIAKDLNMTRLMVGDLLGSVYRKVGVRDKQDLLDAIESAPLD